MYKLMIKYKYLLAFLLIGIFGIQSSAGPSCQSAFINQGPAYTLFQAALNARNNAHAPYSNFYVGAAILTKSGEIYCGCNVENAAYPSTQCAEANAIGSMAAGGDKAIKEVVVLGDCSKGLCTPCGNCRQILAEFADPDVKVHVYDPKEGYKKTFTLGELLPESFAFPQD